MELDPKYDDYDFPTTAPEQREGHPGHLTAAQQAQVHQLRLMLESEGFTQRLDTLTLVWFPSPATENATAIKIPLTQSLSCDSCAPGSST